MNHTSYDTLAGDGRLLTRPLLTGWSEHRASTARRPTAASINSLKGGRTAPFDEQSIINEQLFASLDVAQRVEVDATALLPSPLRIKYSALARLKWNFQPLSIVQRYA